jgi:hypothetical protein
METPIPRQIRAWWQVRRADAGGRGWPEGRPVFPIPCLVGPDAPILFEPRSEASSAPEAATRVALRFRFCRIRSCRISSVAWSAPAAIAPKNLLWDGLRHGKTGGGVDIRSAIRHSATRAVPRGLGRALKGLRRTGKIVHVVSMPRQGGNGFAQSKNKLFRGAPSASPISAQIRFPRVGCAAVTVAGLDDPRCGASGKPGLAARPIAIRRP